MPLWTPGPRSVYVLNNYGANPSDTPGISVVPGASDAEGAWTASGLGVLSADVYWIKLHVHSGLTSTAIKRHVLDIGVDPAGGTSYAAIISDILCGSSAGLASGGAPGHQFLFPLWVAAGSTIGVRIQGSNATAGTVYVGLQVRGQLDQPWLNPYGRWSETLGVTGSNGISFTPGNGADGAYASLGTTTRECWWWQLGYQISSGSITAEATYVELAWGDASNKNTILLLMHRGNTSEGIGSPINENLLSCCALVRVPVGSNLYVRGRCLNAPDTGYQAAAIGIA